MSPTPIRTIFWDIGGVLLSNGWDRHQRARVLADLGVDLSSYEARHEAAKFKWERGLSDHRTFFDQTVFHQPRTFTFDDLWPRVCAESIVLHPGSFEILRTLKTAGHYILATLNNESRELNQHRLDAFALRQYFHYFICSGYVHEMKPNPGIYRDAIDISGLPPESALFIDDKQENCDAAIAQGMHAIRFDSSVQLRASLATYGIAA